MKSIIGVTMESHVEASDTFDSQLTIVFNDDRFATRRRRSNAVHVRTVVHRVTRCTTVGDPHTFVRGIILCNKCSVQIATRRATTDATPVVTHTERIWLAQRRKVSNCCPINRRGGAPRARSCVRAMVVRRCGVGCVGEERVPPPNDGA